MAPTIKRHAGWPVLIGILCMAVLFNRGHGTSVDEGHVYQTTRSLVERGSWQLYEPLNDRRYSRYSPLPSLMAVPFELAGRTAARLVAGPQWERNAAATQLRDAVLFCFGAAVLAGTAALLGTTAAAWGYSPAACTFLLLAYGLGSLAFAYAGSLYVQPVAAFWLAATVASLARGWPAGATSLCWSAAIWCRPDLALLLPAFALLATRRGERMALAAGTVVGGVLTVLTNVLRGDPWLAGGYQGETFLTPPLAGLYGLLFSSGKGLLWFSPLSAIGLLWGLAWSGQRQVRLSVTAAAVYLVAVACWWTWHGGYCWGPRLLLPVLPLTALAVAELWDRAHPRGQFALATVLAFSILLQLVASGSHPFAERAGWRSALATEAEHLFVPTLSILATGQADWPDWWWVQLIQHGGTVGWFAAGAAAVLAVGAGVLAGPQLVRFFVAACPRTRLGPAGWLGAALVLVGLAARPLANLAVGSGRPPQQTKSAAVYVPVTGTYEFAVRLSGRPVQVAVNGRPLRLSPAGGSWWRMTVQATAGSVLRIEHPAGLRTPLVWRTPGEALYRQAVPPVYVAYDDQRPGPVAARLAYEYGWLAAAAGLYLLVAGSGASLGGSEPPPARSRRPLGTGAVNGS